MGVSASVLAGPLRLCRGLLVTFTCIYTAHVRVHQHLRCANPETQRVAPFYRTVVRAEVLGRSPSQPSLWRAVVHTQEASSCLTAFAHASSLLRASFHGLLLF